MNAIETVRQEAFLRTWRAAQQIAAGGEVPNPTQIGEDLAVLRLEAVTIRAWVWTIEAFRSARVQARSRERELRAAVVGALIVTQQPRDAAVLETLFRELDLAPPSEGDTAIPPILYPGPVNERELHKPSAFWEQVERARDGALLARLRDWCEAFAVCPVLTPDTFAEGMRAAKRQVSAIVAALAGPQPDAGGSRPEGSCSISHAPGHP